MRLPEYLDANGLTLTAFAERIGQKVSTVHGWASGRRKPSCDALAAIEIETNGAVTARDFAAPQTEAA